MHILHFMLLYLRDVKKIIKHNFNLNMTIKKKPTLNVSNNNLKIYILNQVVEVNKAKQEK